MAKLGEEINAVCLPGVAEGLPAVEKVGLVDAVKLALRHGCGIVKVRSSSGSRSRSRRARLGG